LYIPKLYREEDREEILAFLSRNNFPALVSFNGERPVATHTPVEVVESEDGRLTVFGHLSRANPQWQTFGDREILLIFQGAHTYISPRWYNHTNVPTWNYMMIHVYGKIRLVQDDELYALLSRLVHNHETSTAYSLEGLPQDFVQKQMAGIVGFTVDVTSVDAGYKLSQNRSDEDHANIVRELENRGDADSLRVAAAMRADRDAPAG
jgi:transcriptional regulator